MTVTFDLERDDPLVPSLVIRVGNANSRIPMRPHFDEWDLLCVVEDMMRKALTERGWVLT